MTINTAWLKSGGYVVLPESLLAINLRILDCGLSNYSQPPDLLGSSLMPPSLQMQPAKALQGTSTTNMRDGYSLGTDVNYLTN